MVILTIYQHGDFLWNEWLPSPAPRRIWEVAVHSFHQPGGKAPGGKMWEDVGSPQLPEKPSSKVLEEISKIDQLEQPGLFFELGTVWSFRFPYIPTTKNHIDIL
jgi:hypothetical protein